MVWNLTLPKLARGHYNGRVDIIQFLRTMGPLAKHVSEIPWERLQKQSLPSLSEMVPEELRSRRLVITTTSPATLKDDAAPFIEKPTSSEPSPAPSTTTPIPAVTTAETVAYQNRELAKHLLVVEVHLTQGCRIAGKPCDCCSGRHPLAMEMLADEATSMSSDPIYQEVRQLAHEIETKANTEAVASGAYAADYPLMAQRARDMRKKLYTPIGAEP